MLRTSNDFSSGASMPVLLNFFFFFFFWSLPVAVEWKIAKKVAVHWPGWLPCPYMVKTFKNLLLEDRGCLMAVSLHKSSGTGGLPKLLKWCLYIDIWPFYGKVKASVCICMGPKHLYGTNVDNSKWLLLWSLWASVAQISCGASLGLNLCTNHQGQGSTKVAKIMVIHWHLTFLRQGQACFLMHLYGKKCLKILFSKIQDGLWLNLCIYHLEWVVYQSC